MDIAYHDMRRRSLMTKEEADQFDVVDSHLRTAVATKVRGGGDFASPELPDWLAGGRIET